MYTFHITFDGQPAVHQLASVCQEALRGLDGIDLVPPRWLHLTVQGAGFTDEVSDADAGAITRAARDRLASLPAPSVRLGPVTITPEAILLPAQPDAALTAVRAALRAAILDVWPPSRLMEADTWTRTSLSPTAIATVPPPPTRRPSMACLARRKPWSAPSS